MFYSSGLKIRVFEYLSNLEKTEAGPKRTLIFISLASGSVTAGSLNIVVSLTVKFI